MRHRKAIRFLSLACVLCAVVPVNAESAWAAPTTSQGSATQRYAKAQKLFDQGKFSEALELFRDVYKETESPNARMWIGNCLVSLGRNAEAYEEMTAAMKEAAKRIEKEPKYAKTRDSAGAELARLESKVGKVVVVVVGGDPSAVSLNGAPLALEKLGTPVAVEPGKAQVEATRADGTAHKGESEIGAGETKTITLSLKDEEKTSGGGGSQEQSSSGTSPTKGAAGGGGGLRIAGFVVAGLGVAGLGAFGVAGLMAKGEFDTLETECGGTKCTDPKYGDVVDRGKTYALVANIGLFAGAACLAAGIPMIILGGASKPKADAQLTGPMFNVLPGGMGVGYRGTF